jgi:hypothetical protein
MDIGAIVQNIMTVFALVAAWYALRSKRGDETYKLAQGWKEAYERECVARKDAETGRRDAEEAEKTAWNTLDKKQADWSAEKNGLLEQIAQERADNGRLRERMARKKLDAENGNSA